MTTREIDRIWRVLQNRQAAARGIVATNPKRYDRLCLGFDRLATFLIRKYAERRVQVQGG